MVAVPAPAGLSAAAPVAPPHTQNASKGPGALTAVLVVLVVSLLFAGEIIGRLDLWGFVEPILLLLSLAVVVVFVLVILRSDAEWCVQYRGVFKKYVTFSGRADLREYWSFAIAKFLILLVMAS